MPPASAPASAQAQAAAGEFGTLTADERANVGLDGIRELGGGLVGEDRRGFRLSERPKDRRRPAAPRGGVRSAAQNQYA